MNKRQVAEAVMVLVFTIGGSVWADDREHIYKDIYKVKDAVVIQLLEEKIPRLANELKRLQEEEDDDYEEVLDEGRELLEEYYETLEYSPELARLFLQIEVMNTEADELVDRFHDTVVEAERVGIKSEIESKLSQIFDLQLKARLQEVDLLTEEIAEIKDMVEKRRGNKARILQRHLREELEESDELLEWW